MANDIKLTIYEVGDWVHYYSNGSKTFKHLGQITKVYRDKVSKQIYAYDIRSHSLNAMEVPAYLVIGRYVENYG